MAGVAIVTIVIGLALAAVLDGTDESQTAIAPVTSADTALLIDPAEYREALWRTEPGGGGEPYSVPARRRGAPLLALDARLAGGHLLLRGDVFTRQAVVVIVTILDGTDEALKVRSIHMPGGSTAFRIGANEQFDLAFAVADWPAAPASVTATAYDRTGYPIEWLREPLGTLHGAGPWR